MPTHMMQAVAWEEPCVGGPGPCARSGHTLTACGGKFYLFGGTGRQEGKWAAHPLLCWCGASLDNNGLLGSNM